MLDETLAQTDLKTGSDVERFQTVKALTQALSEHQAATADNNDKAGFTSFMGGVLTFILFLVGGATVNEKYKWEPRRVPSNCPKRLTANINKIRIAAIASTAALAL